MPCNESGFTDPASTAGWAIVDFDWSNAKEIWAKSKPMNDEELLFQQVQMTVAASPNTTVWVYRCSVYAYPWYTSVRTILEDPAYAPWFINFKPAGPWQNPKCDNNYDPPLCSNYFHMQEQTPGYPSGDGNCAAPACDCGSVPCGFYLWNVSGGHGGGWGSLPARRAAAAISRARAPALAAPTLLFRACRCPVHACVRAALLHRGGQQPDLP